MNVTQQVRAIRDLKTRVARVENGGGAHRHRPLVPVVSAVTADGTSRTAANDDSEVLTAAVQTGLHVALSPLNQGWSQALAFLPAGVTLVDNGLDGEGLQALLAPALIGGAALLLSRLMR
jgi:hypothetical protein